MEPEEFRTWGSSQPQGGCFSQPLSGQTLCSGSPAPGWGRHLVSGLFKNYITIIEMNTYLIIVDILERPSTTGGFWTGSILCPWVLKATITFPPIFLKHNSLSLINNNFFLQPTCSDLAGQVGNIEGSIGRGFSSNHGCSSALEHVVRCLGS